MTTVSKVLIAVLVLLLAFGSLAEARTAVQTRNVVSQPDKIAGLSFRPSELLVRWSVGAEPVLDLQGSKVERYPEKRLARIELPAGISLEQAYQLYRKRPGVVQVQPNYHYQASFIPNDPLYNQQWHLPAIQAPVAWDATRGDPAVIVAVLDSGIDLAHPDLQANLVTGINMITGQEGFQDTNGHGTAVAGIIAAVTNNGLGGTGVAGGVRLMPVKILDDDGSGNSLEISEGVRWAVDHGARVINLSLGMPYSQVTQPDLILREAIAYAYQKGAIVIAAAGNDGQSVHFPARLPHVVAVGAIDQSNLRASFSSWGDSLDLVAPGVQVLTTAPGGKNDYSFSGTSAAAPVVSGIAALLFSWRPELSPGQVEQLLGQSALELGADGWDEEYGYGLVQAAAALQAVLPLPDGEEPDDEPESARPLVLNQWQEGRIATADDVDWLQVTVPAAAYHLEIDPPASMDAVVDVYDSSLTLIRSIDIWGVDVIDVGTLQLEAGHTYYFRVSDFNTRWNYDPYRLRLATEVDRDVYEANDTWETARLIASGVSVAGTLYPDYDSDWYMVDAGAAGQLQLLLQAPEGLDVVVTVANSQQQELQVSTSIWSGETLNRTVLLPDPGQYYIGVAEVDGWFSQQPYQLTVSYPAPLGQVAGKVQLQGRLDASVVTVNLAGMSKGTGVTGNYLFISLEPGIYSLEASAPGYARAYREVILPAGGGDIQLPPATLPAGDLDGDGIITRADLGLAAADYGLAGIADFSGDGRISIGDLALVARNLID